MRFRQRQRGTENDDGILPLINVVFLLLIFFMLAGRLTQAAPFAVVPPVSAEAGLLEPLQAAAPREAMVLIAPDGRLALNGNTLEAEQLKADLEALLARNPALPVSLKADGAAAAIDVVAVMETLREAGVRRLRLFTRAPEGGALAQRKPVQ